MWAKKRLPTLLKFTFPEAQVLACAIDKLRSELLSVTYEKLLISDLYQNRLVLYI
jgi:hypothetical protein